MATQATNIQIERPGVGARLRGMAEGVLGFFVAVAEANPRMKAVQRLSEMSDEELAERGLKRDDIVRHVFRDIYYM